MVLEFKTMDDFAAAIWWYILLSLYGLAVAPISFVLFRSFPDYGLLLSRPLGMLLVTYICWILGYTVGYPFSAAGVVVILFALAAVSAMVFWPRRRRILRAYRASLGFLVLGECLALIAFLMLVQARRSEPNLNHTEMGMDLAFFRSLWRGTDIPPVDPWFAGEPINYYYGGYMIFAAVAKLSGLSTGVAYNLAVASVFMLAVSVAFVLGATLTGSRVWGGVTALATAVIGNLAGFVRLIESGKVAFSGWDMRWTYLWKCSRVIYDGPNETINEFPFFAQVWANLHGHMSNIPWVLLFVALVVSLLRSGVYRLPAHVTLGLRWPLLLVLVISLGGLGFVSLFDLPTFSVLYGCAVLILIGQAYSARGLRGHVQDFLFLFSLFAVPFLAYLAYLPFHREFVPPLQYPAMFPFGEEENTLIRFVSHNSGFSEFLAVFGLHISVMLAYLIWLVVDSLPAVGKELMGMVSVVSGVIFLLLVVVSGSVVWALTLCLALLFSGLFVWRGVLSSHRGGIPMAERFALGGVALCLWIWWFCEVFYIKDNYGSQRMNTLFKFHFPTWLILGWALSFLVYRIWRDQRVVRRGLLILPGVLFVLSMSCPFVYFLPTLTGSLDPNQPATLDGQDYLERWFPAAYKMVCFIDENIPGQPVILEASGGAYQYGSPAPECVISSNTGAPTVIGWVNHEQVWRGHAPEVSQRHQDVATIFNTTDIETAKKILVKYNVEYVYVGGQEKKQFRPEGLTKFAQLPEHFSVVPQTGGMLYSVLYEFE